MAFFGSDISFTQLFRKLSDKTLSEYLKLPQALLVAQHCFHVVDEGWQRNHFSFYKKPISHKVKVIRRDKCWSLLHCNSSKNKNVPLINCAVKALIEVWQRNLLSSPNFHSILSRIGSFYLICNTNRV